MSALRRTIKIVPVILLAFTVFLLAVFGGLQTGIGQRLLASLISSVASSPGFELEI